MSGNNTPMTIDELRCDPDSPVDREEYTNEFGNLVKILKREKEFPWEFDSDDEGANEPKYHLEFDSQDPDAEGTNEDEIYYSKPSFQCIFVRAILLLHVTAMENQFPTKMRQMTSCQI